MRPARDFKQGSRTSQPTRDSFYLPALKVQYDLEKVSFISNTSYFYHKDYAALDYTNYFAGIFDGDAMQYLPGDAPSQAFITNQQNAFTEEARVQSTDRDALVDWTVGVFYSDQTQHDGDITTNGQATYTSVHGNTPSFLQYITARDKQIAGYADVDVNITHALKASAGVRVSHDEFSFEEASAFSGFAQTPLSGSQSDTPVTPKFGLSYQLDADNFLYATAAKGFRQGGVNGNTPSNLCGSDLAALGLTTTPVAYKPDSLWSYEIGAKDSLFGGRLGLDSSVYTLKWKSIQQSVRLPSCGFSYVDNLGTATGVGGDLAARFKVTQDFLAGASAGYVSLTYDRTIYEGANAVLVNKGGRHRRSTVPCLRLDPLQVQPLQPQRLLSDRLHLPERHSNPCHAPVHPAAAHSVGRSVPVQSNSAASAPRRSRADIAPQIPQSENGPASH